ncbi:AbiTii domain-containing protein, partial [Vibrio cholerae]
NASNLILLLQGKVYKDYACNDISATISSTVLYEIQHTVRSRILELTLELEKSVPEAMDIKFGKSINNQEDRDQIQQISQQIIYGNVATAVTGGIGSSISIEVSERDNPSLIESLVRNGISESDASDLAQIMETETPTSIEEPFGDKAKSWIASNLTKAAKGTWGVGISVATKVLTEAAMKYYGLK